MPPTEGLTDGKAAIPLYQQVIDIIKNEISSGAYKAGARIPNEFELAESYKVGRVTVRRAIEELVQQGYLTKRQGKGTFVNAPKLKRKIRQKDDVQSFSDACRVNGMEAGARVISRKILPADSTEAQFFGVPVGTDLICVGVCVLPMGSPSCSRTTYTYTRTTPIYQRHLYLTNPFLSSCATGRAVRPRLPTRARSRSRVRRPRSLGCWRFPLANPCFTWMPSFSMSSGGRLSSVVSGSLDLVTFLTSRTLRMEAPGGSSQRAFPYRSRRERNRSAASRQSV